MPKRPITALLVALALLLAAPAAYAQDPTATPGGAPSDASQPVKDIYSDYRNDGKIDVCDHERIDLQDALDTIEPDFDTDNPDFRAALEVGIQRHDDGRCESATATATATADATETATAEPTTDSGELPPATDDGTDDGTGGDQGGAIPPEDGSLPPEGGATPEAGFTPVPTAPVPTAVPPSAAVTPVPSATPAIVNTSSDANLLLPGILLGLALLCGLALALFPVAARRDPRVDAAWQEFRFRTRNTWTDFAEWFRLGR